jgi:hypothetical protein
MSIPETSRTTPQVPEPQTFRYQFEFSDKAQKVAIVALAVLASIILNFNGIAVKEIIETATILYLFMNNWNVLEQTAAKNHSLIEEAGLHLTKKP